MRKLSVSALEAERELAAEAAREWADKHEHELPAVVQTSEHQEQVMLGGVRRARLQYLGMLAEGDDDAIIYGERGRFLPMVSQPEALDVKRIAQNKRLERALAMLRPEQLELLEAFALEGKTLNELRRAGESRQAVHERIAWAKNALAKAILETAAEPVVLTEEDL